MSRPPTPAATVLLLRQSSIGLKVFMVQRHMRSGFLPTMWVFPGGRIEPSDVLEGVEAVTGGERAGALFSMTPTEVRAALVCAARETFEEAGVWLGSGVLPDATRKPLQTEELELASVLTEHGASLDLDVMVPWARWVTPFSEGRRFDAVFLAAEVEAEHGRHDEVETIASGWFTPRELIDGGLERFGLAPPTFMVLRDLASMDTVAEALAAPRDLRPIQPVPSMEGSGLVMLLPGAEGHPEHARPGLPSRLRMTIDRWVVED